ncbi:hypothetical protein J6590_081558 [Homalodisca vitripennis]|nr:hypothetical protein J6590_081558 [Homalodisca vitripennis]
MPNQAPQVSNPANPASNANVGAAQIVPANQAVSARLINLPVANLIRVKDFFRPFENAAGTGRWSKDDMVRGLQLKVKGPAATFLSTLWDHAGQETKQQRNESVEAFAYRVRRLDALTISHQQDPVEQRIVHEEAEMRMLHAFLHGLSRVTGHKFPESWDEARSQPTRESKPVFSTLVTCFKCNRPGHMARECRAPRHGHSEILGEAKTFVGIPKIIVVLVGEEEIKIEVVFQSRGTGYREDGRRTNVNVEYYNCHDREHYANQCSKLNPRSENRKGLTGPMLGVAFRPPKYTKTKINQRALVALKKWMKIHKRLMMGSDPNNPEKKKTQKPADFLVEVLKPPTRLESTLMKKTPYWRANTKRKREQKPKGCFQNCLNYRLFSGRRQGIGLKPIPGEKNKFLNKQKECKKSKTLISKKLNFDILDFSSESGEEYALNFDDMETSDREDVSNDLPSPLMPRPDTPQNIPASTPWFRSYPPEPELDIGPNFRVKQPGPRHGLPSNNSPISYALLFFMASFWSKIVEQTNKYANKIIETKRNCGTMKRFSRIKKWVNVSLTEMKKYFSLLINMGLDGDSTKHRRAFWDTRRSQHNSFFPQTMNVNRFELILSNFHLTSREGVGKGEPCYDPWIKVRFFLDRFNGSFKNYFILAKIFVLTKVL